VCSVTHIYNCCEKMEFYEACLLFLHLNWAPPCMSIGQLRWKTARVLAICLFPFPANKFLYSVQSVPNASIVLRRPGLLKLKTHTNISADFYTNGGFYLVADANRSSLIVQPSVRLTEPPAACTLNEGWRPLSFNYLVIHPLNL